MAQDDVSTQAGQAEATAGAGVEPEGTGYAPPDPGVSDPPPSEIPVGVDALPEDVVEAAQERGGGDDGDALDVSAIVAEEGGDVPVEAQADDAEPGEAPVDDPGEGATTRTDAEAQVAPNTGENV